MMSTNRPLGLGKIVACLMLLFGAGGGLWLEETQVELDLQEFRMAKDPVVIVDVISARRLFRTNLNQERFEKYLESTGPDYTLMIKSRGSIGELTDALEALPLNDVGDLEHVDLRYRVVFLDGEKRLKVLFVGPFGDILEEGKRLRATTKDGWVTKLWASLAADVVKLE